MSNPIGTEGKIASLLPYWPHSTMDSMQVSGAWDLGSIPNGATTKYSTSKDVVFFWTKVSQAPLEWAFVMKKLSAAKTEYFVGYKSQSKTEHFFPKMNPNGATIKYSTSKDVGFWAQGIKGTGEQGNRGATSFSIRHSERTGKPLAVDGHGPAYGVRS